MPRVDDRGYNYVPRKKRVDPKKAVLIPRKGMKRPPYQGPTKTVTYRGRRG